MSHVLRYNRRKYAAEYVETELTVRIIWLDCLETDKSLKVLTTVNSIKRSFDIVQQYQHRADITGLSQSEWELPSTLQCCSAAWFTSMRFNLFKHIKDHQDHVDEGETFMKEETSDESVRFNKISRKSKSKYTTDLTDPRHRTSEEHVKGKNRDTLQILRSFI